MSQKFAVSFLTAAHSQTERGEKMHGDFFNDFMPWSVNSEALDLRDRRDLLYLGKENLQYLAKFWKKHADKMYAKVKTEPDYYRREKYERDAEDSAYKAREISKIAEDAVSKPRLFEKPTFVTGSHVTCFLEDPDRFVSGILVKVKTDAYVDENPVVIEGVVMSIRVNDGSGYHLIDYIPDGFSIFMTSDFEYFKTHSHYFRIYLNYHTGSLPERDKCDRMISCVS